LTCSFVEYVVRQEQWVGGLAVGYLWTKIVCSAGPEEVNELSATSVFAETLASFSTVSQETRHEADFSWLVDLKHI
jgi:hypothetical protein